MRETQIPQMAQIPQIIPGIRNPCFPLASRPARSPVIGYPPPSSATPSPSPAGRPPTAARSSPMRHSPSPSRARRSPTSAGRFTGAGRRPRRAARPSPNSRGTSSNHCTVFPAAIPPFPKGIPGFWFLVAVSAHVGCWEFHFHRRCRVSGRSWGRERRRITVRQDRPRLEPPFPASPPAKAGHG